MKVIQIILLSILTGCFTSQDSDNGNSNIMESDKLIESFGFRYATNEELGQIDFEYQSGMELIFWLAELKKDEIDSKVLFEGIIKSLDSINRGIDFPLAEYNNYRDLTHVLGFTLGEILHIDYNWKWYFKEIFNDDYLGFVIVSPDKSTGIKVEHYFYDNVMYHRDIKLDELIKKVELKGFNDNDKDFEFYEPWKNDKKRATTQK